MNLAYKQLLRETLKNKINLFLLLLLSFFTSFMYFFVRFSIDGNINHLETLPSLTENESLYYNALMSNATLANTILSAFTLLTGLVFIMYFYRFFKKNSKLLGTLKALGFKNTMLRSFFVYVSGILSLIGALLGYMSGYFTSDILIQASIKSYDITYVVKSLHLTTLMIGLFVPTIIFCFITTLTYQLIKRKEIAQLISPLTTASYGPFLNTANRLTKILPTKKKFPMRLALRKPIALLLILIAVTTFSVMFILAYSLNLSSQKIYDSQTQGHHYLFDTSFEVPQHLAEPIPNTMPYLNSEITLILSETSLTQQALAFEKNSVLFELLDTQKQVIPSPESGHIVISEALHELYNLNIGDTVQVDVDGKILFLSISQIAFNATLNSVYINPYDLSSVLDLPTHTYTGIWSLENHFSSKNVITHEEKIDTLERSFVSNRLSAVINQIIGCLVGCILLFLALLINFQDSTRDILILSLLGYKPPIIRKMLVDIYKPIIWVFFFFSLWPALTIVKAILRSLSLQIGDYMPFQTNIWVLLGTFILLNVIYLLVQFTFSLGIKKLVQSDTLYGYTSTDSY